MSDPRIMGITLMLTAIAAFLGSTSEALPPEAFFPAMLLFAIGAFKFLRTNREAMAGAEKRAYRAVNPTIRESRTARALADKQAAAKAIGIAPSNLMKSSDESSVMTQATDVNAIELDGAEEDLSVTTDVSFPIEIQEGDALADQLGKLNRLLEQSVLTEEEYAIAKSKLLG